VNTRSLSFRLVAWYAGVLLWVFVLLGVLTFLFLRHYLEANLLDTQMRRARQIADTLVAHAGRSDEQALRGQIESLYSPEVNDRFIRITRADGAPVYASGAPQDRRFDPAQVPPPPAGAAACIASPRKRTRSMAAPNSSAPAHTSAVNSPRLCPDTPAGCAPPRSPHTRQVATPAASMAKETATLTATRPAGPMRV